MNKLSSNFQQDTIGKWTCFIIILQIIISFNTRATSIDYIHVEAPKSSNNTVTYVDEYSGISVLDFSGDYSREINNSVNVDARIDVATELFQNIDDQYDFIVVFTNFPVESNGAAAFATLISNDVEGIGKPIFDNSDTFGSQQLQLYVDMKNCNGQINSETFIAL